ncbi:hypothetical protein CUR178_08096 [Leishmania enriettii]|uniref:Protein kinase domain-containing protein n=1 Tax=Leishmania enriettii TaxID=5663 RepID=A0A836HYD3_LEIEN|nr:hypothetical protein CUR178_08096 [Leishmania enriettii]
MPHRVRHSISLTPTAPRAAQMALTTAGSPTHPLTAQEQEAPVQPPSRQHQPLQTRCSISPVCRCRAKRFGRSARNTLCRIDVCWTLFYFVFLVCVGATSCAVSYRLVNHSLIESWHTLHDNRIASVNKLIDQSTDRVHDMAAGLLALYMKTQFIMESERTLSVLCALMEEYDLMRSFAAFSAVSLSQLQAISCWRESPQMNSGGQLVGAISHDHRVNATYYVNHSNFMFNRPLEVQAIIPEDRGSVAGILADNYAASELIELTKAYYEGSIDSVDQRLTWLQPPFHSHLIYYNYPAGLIYRGLTLPPNVSVTDCMQVCINGTRLALNALCEATSGFLFAAFINRSLGDADPLIMANNWGQQTMQGDVVFPSSPEPTTYLKSSSVRPPLMREALERVDLSRMQEPGYKHCVDFRFNDAHSIITVWAYTSPRGLTLPLVYVSSHEIVTGPYLRLRDTVNGILAATIVLVSFVFWAFVRLYFVLPLLEITRLLDRSVQRGTRALYHAGKHGIGALAEVRALGNAHNAAMRQLREVDAFIPAAVRQQLRRGTVHTTLKASLEAALPGPNVVAASSQPRAARLARHLSTVVYITARSSHPPPGALHSTSTAPAPSSMHSSENIDTDIASPIPSQRLVAVVERAVHAVNAANSGPFATPAALGTFASVVHELVHTHRGTVLHLRPDACVLHFHAAVRAHLPPQQEQQPGTAADVDMAVEAHAQQDARDAAAFALALLAWVEEQQAAAGQPKWPHVPEVRALLDTSLFTCGQYRPAGSEQTTAVALGRDVLRDAIRVVERIGVRVAMTEETAMRVRGGSLAGNGDGDTSAVRAIPVEVLRTGHGEDTLVLYEALPGRAAGDAAWQLYARCCVDGFARMRQGDYAGALAAYRSVADVSGLELGLLPPCLRREATASQVTGGAVSVQAARLMRECERRLRAGLSDGFQRVPRRPPGIDAVLRDGIAPVRTAAERLVRATASAVPDACAKPRRAASGFTAPRSYPEVRERYVVQLSNGASATRVVVPTPPAWVRDNHGLYWHLTCRRKDVTPSGLWPRRFLALGSAGAIASVNYIMYRQVHPVVAKVIRDAPLGPMCDALRSATPVCGPTAQQDAAIQRLMSRYHELRHPNILTPLAFSQSLEGGVVLIWEFCPGGTLRQLLARYSRVKSITFACFGLQMLSALSHLHERGLAHGNLNLDTVMVDSNGHCRLIGQSTDHALEREIFDFRLSCYLSPAMVAGALPTPECDMFCYGLLAMEAVTQQPCWRWATAAEYEGHRPLQPSAKELADLMAAGGEEFADAVAQGRVVLNLQQLDAAPTNEHHNDTMRNVCRRLLSLDPSLRPTAAQLRDENKSALNLLGLTMEEDAR